ncbi:MAG: argininosuccinate lyase [Candidatus Bathycorpusculaceae bacterium]
MSEILQGGRLRSTRKEVVKFASSLKDDRKLSNAVVAINKAHIVMLMEQRIISWQDGAKLLEALSQLSYVKLKSSVEDVHVAVEEEVTERVGLKIGGNLNVAKSRNDQVTTAIRMELRKDLLQLMLSVLTLQEALIKTAENHVKTVILGYTHLQPAQPTTFAHYLLSHVDALERDLERLEDAFRRVNICPMGAGALATSSFSVNRDRMAELLGFDGVMENSIDAVGSRDFIMEILAILTLIAVNMSRLAEDLIIWSSTDFGIIELPDSFSSTSSIMPQKKNPDVLEVIRARSSQMLGNFVTSATTMKALPSSYNLDFQEITPKIWESLETTIASLKMLSKLVPNLKVTADFFNKALTSFSAATELANMLVRKHKVPFRTAHKIVGALVKVLIESKLTFLDATPELLRKVAEDCAGLKLSVSLEDICEVVDPYKLVEAYSVKGGPSPPEVKRMLQIRRQRVGLSRSNLKEKERKLADAEDKLESTVKSYSLSQSSAIQERKI